MTLHIKRNCDLDDGNGNKLCYRNADVCFVYNYTPGLARVETFACWRHARFLLINSHKAGTFLYSLLLKQE